MAWVRIHDGAMSHPKIIGLTATAFRLWVAGLSYCQQHLTDGVIPQVAIPALLGKKTDADALVAAGLWHRHESGYVVHDYADWNDTRAVVTSKKTQAKQRHERWKTRSDNAFIDASPDAPSNASLNAQPPIGLVKSGSGVETEPTTLSADIGAAAAAFLDEYVEVYAACRNGAFYRHRSESLDFATATALVQAYPDAAHRRDMLRLFLLKKDWATKNEPGTIRQFDHMAAQCDALIRAAKAR